MSEFLKRLTSQFWKRSYQVGLEFIRWFLVVTFIAVVVATLAECQPFYKYWQVIPDPGANCRQGHAQLITMGVSDVITDLLLVVFPIPIVLSSTIPAKRKLSLVLLFSFSLILVGITLYRVTSVIERHSDQQFRSLLASLEILAAAAVSNAVVLGSFIRDRGEKKKRFRFGSTGGSSSLDTANNQQRSRVLTQRHWGSDADLVGDLGIRVARDLEEHASNVPRPAPVALPPAIHAASVTPEIKSNWNFPSRPSVETDETELKLALQESEKQLDPNEIPTPTPRRVSFFDVGGLLGEKPSSTPRHPSVSLVSPIEIPHMTHSPSLLPTQPQSEPTPAQYHRRGSHTLLEDIGGLVPTSTPQQRPAVTLQSAPSTRNFSRPQRPTEEAPLPSIRVTDSPGDGPNPQLEEPRQGQSISLRDVGGLLD